MSEKQKLQTSSPHFDPELGLLPHGSVKDQLKALLEVPELNQADTCLVAISTPKTYAFYAMGRFWDGLALNSLQRDDLILRMKPKE